jgi:hypothetical protein
VSLKLYMDVHVRRAVTQGLRLRVTQGLRLRGVDVVTAQEDGNSRLPDRLLLDRAQRCLGRPPSGLVISRHE